MARYDEFWLRWWPVLMLVGLVPLAGYLFFVLALVDWHARAEAEASLRRAAHDSAADIARYLGSQVALLHTMARHEALDAGEPEAAREYLQRVLLQHPEWQTIILTDRSRQLLNLRFAPGTALPELREPATLEAAWLGQRAVVGNLANDTVAVRTAVVRDGETRYTLTVPLRPTLLSHLLSVHGRADGWTSVVLDGADTVIGHSGGDHIGRKLSHIDRSAIRADAPMRRITNFAGSDALGVLVPVEGTGWLVGVQLPVTAVEGPYESIRTALKLGAALVIAATIVLIGIVAYRSRTAAELRQRSMQGELAAARTQTQERSLLLSSMSHELRTPLNAVIGFADAMQQQVFGPLGNRRYVEHAGAIAESGRYLLSLINDLLDMAKTEALELKLEPERVDLAEAVTDVHRLVGGLAQRAGVTLATDLPGGLCVWADRRALKQMLLNLLSNAMKFAPGGCVTVAAAPGPDGVRLSVRDDGIGMSPDELALALQPYRQVDSALARQHRGTGLGLPLVKRLAEQHGGRLEIVSAKGRGTTATIVLPLPASS